MTTVQIVGGGLAGTAAALAASAEGANVVLREKSRFPRHKVCGEFLSPESAIVLDRLGVLPRFLELQPARIRRMVLRFEHYGKEATLPEAAFGLSRFALDAMLFHAAAVAAPAAMDEPPQNGPLVVATGRPRIDSSSNRLFGFKTHFTGPAGDAIELYFFRGGYLGINPIENGSTNLCGVAEESLLRRFGFNIDALIDSLEPLRRRAASLTRSLDWLTTGPVVFHEGFECLPADHTYPAGDALSFVDPFTGSGMLTALETGRLAGIAATRGLPNVNYISEARRLLRRQFMVSGLFRRLLRSGWAERLAPFVPGRILYLATRPHLK